MPKKRNTPKTQPKKKLPTKVAGSFSRLGNMAGSFISPTMGKLGGAAGAAIDRIIGRGDYTLRGNSIMSGQAPAFMSSENGIRITHREYLGEVTSSILFKNRGWYINPGNSALFRWLSTVARNFECFEFHGLAMCYNARSGTALSSSSAAMGSVILSTEYDVLKPAFTSKQDAEAYAYTTADVPYQNIIHGVECKPSLTVLPKKFVTSSPTPSSLQSNDDPRMHYQGLFQLITIGQQTDESSLGELWVTYDVTLFLPRPSVEVPNVDLAQIRTAWTLNSAPLGVPVLRPQSRSGRVGFSWNTGSNGKFSVRASFNTPGIYLLMRNIVHETTGAFQSDNLWQVSGSAYATYFCNRDNNVSYGYIDAITRSQDFTTVDRAYTNMALFTVNSPGAYIQYPSVGRSDLLTAGIDTYYAFFIQDLFTTPSIFGQIPVEPSSLNMSESEISLLRSILGRSDEITNSSSKYSGKPARTNAHSEDAQVPLEQSSSSSSSSDIALTSTKVQVDIGSKDSDDDDSFEYVSSTLLKKLLAKSGELPKCV